MTSSPTTGVLSFDLRDGTPRALCSRPAAALAVDRRERTVFAVALLEREGRMDEVTGKVLWAHERRMYDQLNRTACGPADGKILRFELAHTSPEG